MHIISEIALLAYSESLIRAKKNKLNDCERGILTHSDKYLFSILQKK